MDNIMRYLWQRTWSINSITAPAAPQRILFCSSKGCPDWWSTCELSNERLGLIEREKARIDKNYAEVLVRRLLRPQLFGIRTA